MSIRIIPGNALKFASIRRPPSTSDGAADAVPPVLLGPGPGYRRDFTPAPSAPPAAAPGRLQLWTYAWGFVAGFCTAASLALLLARLH